MKAKVVFRVFKDGQVIALFPYVDYNNRGECLSYMHIGQHSGADYDYCVKMSRLADESEYKPLKKELEDIGYNLKVVKRKHKGYGDF